MGGRRHRRLIGLALVLGLAVVVGVAIAAPGSAGVRQPVPFPHDRHVALGMACEACHSGAREGVHAGIPPTYFCANCHRPDRSSPPTGPELSRYLESGTEIPWIQVHRTRRFVYFSHRRHAGIANLDCAQCHGDVQSRSTPFTEPFAPTTGMPGMLRCLSCHRAEGVTVDCAACHR
jgi:hypothetical protein